VGEIYGLGLAVVGLGIPDAFGYYLGAGLGGTYTLMKVCE